MAVSRVRTGTSRVTWALMVGESKLLDTLTRLLPSCT